MNQIAIFWDESSLWGLLVWRAAVALGFPYHLVKGIEIAQGGLSGKFSLLIVPGGTARLKSLCLGEAGHRAIREWVAAGGNYLGLCGGAGLGLSNGGNPARTAMTGSGLGLCPWHRAEITEWIQHFTSGHVPVRVGTHPLVPESMAGTLANLPIWWPGRFAAPGNEDGVSVLGRYEAGEIQSFPEDLCIADLPLCSLSASVLEQWKEMYGVSLAPEFLYGQPCVLHGAFGRGTYTLSYSHLETPGSAAANRWFAHMVRRLSGVEQTGMSCDVVPDWDPEIMPVLWDDADLLRARAEVEQLIRLGLAQGLLFERSPWLVGWRARVPGAGLNTLRVSLCALTGTRPTPDGERLWKERREIFCRDMEAFRQGVETLLLGQRLSFITPEAVPLKVLEKQRASLFGSPMQGGGLYKAVRDVIDDLLYCNLGGNEHDDGARPEERG